MYRLTPGSILPLPTLLAMAEHPRIIGVKDSSANILKIASLLAARPDFQVFAGTGQRLAAILEPGRGRRDYGLGQFRSQTAAADLGRLPQRAAGASA